MGTQANVLTPQQMRCIYALARGGGISNDDLHAVVFTTTGKDSIRLLTTADAKQVIDRLKRLTGQETTAPHNRPTKEQVAKSTRWPRSWAGPTIRKGCAPSWRSVSARPTPPSWTTSTHATASKR